MSKISKIFLFISLISICHTASISNGIDKKNVPFYTAAVIELNPFTMFHGTKNIEKKVLDIIKSEDVTDANIVIFPESVLNEPKTAILLPNSISFCDDPYANHMLRAISCAARDTRKYVVIDLNIKIKCADDDQPLCANPVDSTNLYNMAMVFDRYGDVIAKYRKYHLFNERGVQQTTKPDLVTFKTNFNVTFGVCVCFDLMFADPAGNLIDQGVKHFVYPTMWSSELPYLTATQFQQSWAYANDVTLLAANANLPVLKTSGSGIYAGRLGALRAYVTETEKTKILIAQVPIDSHLSESHQSHRNKLPVRGNSESDFGNGVIHPYSSRSNAAFDLLQDDLSRYTVKFLNFTENLSQAGRVCNNGICCNYNVVISEIDGEHQKNSYIYAISVFNGRRNYKPMKDLFTAQTVCSLIVCAEIDSKKQCGKRIPTQGSKSHLKFEKLTLETELPISYAKAMSNTLTTELLPLAPTEFEYETSTTAENDRNAVRLSLKVPMSNLLTFAIFSRDYNKDITN